MSSTLKMQPHTNKCLSLWQFFSTFKGNFCSNYSVFYKVAVFAVERKLNDISMTLQTERAERVK